MMVFRPAAMLFVEVSCASMLMSSGVGGMPQ